MVAWLARAVARLARAAAWLARAAAGVGVAVVVMPAWWTPLAVNRTFPWVARVAFS
jgi:hypothetical protein